MNSGTEKTETARRNRKRSLFIERHHIVQDAFFPVVTVRAESIEVQEPEGFFAERFPRRPVRASVRELRHGIAVPLQG